MLRVLESSQNQADGQQDLNLGVRKNLLRLPDPAEILGLTRARGVADPDVQ